MATVAELREKYDLHMTVERFVSIEDEYVVPGAYAYVNGYPVYENRKTRFKYMIGIDAETLCEDDDDDDTDGNDEKEPVLDLNGQARVQVDTTFCHLHPAATGSHCSA